MHSKARRILIVGGVAGGASCAARLRRMDEAAEITIFERGPYVSFANCGLPYRVGNVIPDDTDLLVASPELLRSRFLIDVRTRHEVIAIDRATRRVTVSNLGTGIESQTPYDALVLSPGAVPVMPRLAGIDLPGISTVRNIPDIQQLRAWITQNKARRAAVVGGGFIGLEMAENLHHLGLQITLVEMLDQIMPPMDPEMVRPLETHLRERGIELVLGDGVEGFEAGEESKLIVKTRSGARHVADLVILSTGVRPDTSLAKAAGLKLGPRGGIRVDAQMRTSDPNIYAVGDAVEVHDVVLGESTLLALAGPANRQARVAADAIAGRETQFRGVQGTAICGVFDMAGGSTGASEKALRQTGRSDFDVVYLHPGHHVDYYPGAEPIHLKVIFRKADGRLLGAQAVGKADVARKIDVFAAFIQMGATAYDLAEAEMAYAPQFGSAKDAVNLAGMIAANALRGDAPLAPWQEAVGSEPSFRLDVREPEEVAQGAIPGAVHIPIGKLRESLELLPKDRRIGVYCHSGKRSHDAIRLLRQHGFQAENLSGGYLTYLNLQSDGARL
jgi:NADPH-dependent 2,4-dienoyl-CoA reductase/sulfur reductase-like enzyme/rhodanese-related sulfurtransferase